MLMPPPSGAVTTTRSAVRQAGSTATSGRSLPGFGLQSPQSARARPSRLRALGHRCLAARRQTECLRRCSRSRDASDRRRRKSCEARRLGLTRSGSFPRAKNPSDWLSGFQNGPSAPSVPTSGRLASASRERNQIMRRPPGTTARKAIVVPSGETASIGPSWGRLKAPPSGGGTGNVQVGALKGACQKNKRATLTATSDNSAAAAHAKRTRLAGLRSSRGTSTSDEGGVDCASSRSSRTSTTEWARRRGSFCRHRTSSLRMRGGVAAGSARPVGFVLDDRGERVGDRLAVRNGRRAGQHLVQHAAERPDVRPLVHGLAARLLRTHVGSGAEDDSSRRVAGA